MLLIAMEALFRFGLDEPEIALRTRARTPVAETGRVAPRFSMALRALEQEVDLFKWRHETVVLRIKHALERRTALAYWRLFQCGREVAAFALIEQRRSLLKRK